MADTDELLSEDAKIPFIGDFNPGKITPITKDLNLYEVVRGVGSTTVNQILDSLQKSDWQLPKTERVTFQEGAPDARASYQTTPEGNRLRFMSDAAMQDAGIVAHELTHALDDRMKDAYTNNKAKATWANSKEDKDFNDAYEKIGTPQKLKGTPVETTLWGAYRNSNLEARAWAVGNMTKTPADKTERGYTHQDATLATDADILRDKYNKMMDSKKTPWYSELMHMVGW